MALQLQSTRGERERHGQHAKILEQWQQYLAGERDIGDFRAQNVVAAQCGGFTAAARALHTVQSNVSTHVARLERELGVLLVDRTTGALTEEGRAVVERVRRVDVELDAMVADVASVRDEVTGSARIGVIGTTARWLTARLLEATAEAHPGVSVVVVDATTTSLVPQLHDGLLDLAVVALPLHDPDIETEPLFIEDLVLVTAPDHELASVERVSLIRLGSTTHTNDFDQRLVRLSFSKKSTALTVTAPASRAVAPPGYYMLFLVDAPDVPSVARIVRLR